MADAFIDDFSSIRLATIEDAAVGAGLARDAYDVYRTRMDRAPAPVYYNYAEVFARGNSFLLTVDKVVVGMVTLAQDESWLNLSNLAVAPSHQGRGYGKILMCYAERVCADLNLKEIRLYTNSAMVENITMYTRNGFVIRSRSVVDGYSRVFMSKIVARESSE